MQRIEQGICDECYLWWDHAGCAMEGCKCENLAHRRHDDDDEMGRLARVYLLRESKQARRHKRVLRAVLSKKGGPGVGADIPKTDFSRVPVT